MVPLLLMVTAGRSCVPALRLPVPTSSSVAVPRSTVPISATSNAPSTDQAPLPIDSVPPLASPVTPPLPMVPIVGVSSAKSTSPV